MKELIWKKKARGRWGTNSTVYVRAQRPKTLIEKLREAIKKNYS